jgi:intracellular septation protein
VNTKAFLHLTNEFAPVVAFFAAAQFYSFYTATAVLIVSTLAALLAGWIFERRLPILPIISGVFVVISGFITICYQAPDALIVADSLYYFLMGATILAGLFFKLNILKRIFDATFAMYDEGWNILAARWILIFLLAAAANETARLTLSPEEWVNFKILKIITITVFGFYQFTLSKRYRIPEESNAWGLRNP